MPRTSKEWFTFRGYGRVADDEDRTDPATGPAEYAEEYPVGLAHRTGRVGPPEAALSAYADGVSAAAFAGLIITASAAILLLVALGARTSEQRRSAGSTASERTAA